MYVCVCKRMIESSRAREVIRSSNRLLASDRSGRAVVASQAAENESIMADVYLEACSGISG